MRKIILASASPRRKEILRISGLRFNVRSSSYRENLGLSLKPRELARHLSRRKAEYVAPQYKNALVIAADTFIVFRNSLLGKPRSSAEAVKMLQMLSGKIHSVITGFTIIDTGSRKIATKSMETRVFFRKLTKKEIQSYVRSGEPMDKAGAYAIQGLGAAFVEKIEGDYFNVMGLPLCALLQSLKAFGIETFK